MANKKQKIEKEIAEYEALLKDSSVPAEEKQFAEEEIADLKKQLEGMKDKPDKEPKAHKSAKKHTKFRKEDESFENWKSKVIKQLMKDAEISKEIAENAFIDHKKMINKSFKNYEGVPTVVARIISAQKNKFDNRGKKEKPKKDYKKSPTYKYKGKSIKDLDDDECAELVKETKERREKQAKSSEKSKSKPVIEKVAGHVVKAVKQAIDNVAAADIDKAEIKKFERVEKAGIAFVTELRTILGSEFDKNAVNEEFKEITDLIEKLRKKYAEPKKAAKGTKIADKFIVTTYISGVTTEKEYDNYEDAKQAFEDLVTEHDYSYENRKSDFAENPENEDDYIELTKN